MFRYFSLFRILTYIQERYFLNEINKKLLIEPKKQLEWIKQGFKEVAQVWDVVAKLDPTSLARIICGRHWVDEGFLKQQLVFDPRVFFPPTEPAPLTITIKKAPAASPDTSYVDTPPVDFESIPAAIDPPLVEPSLAPHITIQPASPVETIALKQNLPSITYLPCLPYNSATHLYRVLDEWADARDRDRLTKFTFLCTNCVFIPWGGLGDGVFVVHSEDNAPHPHGSCNVLHLPEKDSYESFRDMMEEMVRNIDGWIYQLV